MPTPGHRFRQFINSPRVIAASTLSFSTASLMIACSADGVTGPDRAASASRYSAGKSAEERAAEDSAKAAKKEAKAEAKAEHDLAKAQLDSLKDDWEAYKKAVKRTGVKGDVLRCEPQPREVETRTVGPKGGTINVGPHRLVIPAGALMRDVEITGTAPSNPAVNVEFEPHGLRFQKPVEMVIDYKQCIVPDSTELGVTYMLSGWRATEKMPSSDVRRDRKITALTDHFSGFAVTWGYGARDQF